ncbi:transcription factor DIVARICATA-like [Panicum hallii]|nr:transcription factor DIVARICATA-like [Panicum hallii]
MDPKATQEWTSCEEEEFKVHFAELWYEKSCDRMEALAKRFPAKSIQQLRDKYAEVFADMLCGETDGEPSRDDATNDWDDWYKLLEGETHDLVMDPLVETPLFEPSKQLLFEPAGDQEEIQKSHCKSSRKRKQCWTAEEHRDFLRGVNCLGRGAWKFISDYFVPSRTPAQLASHAQKYFDRIDKNELDDTRQRHSINDVRLVNHGMNISAHSYTEPGKGKGIASSILPTILTEDIGILHGLAQGMPEFGQASNSPSNLAGQMTHNNHILESFQLEVSGIPSPREQGSVLLDQTRAENRAYPSRKRNIGAATNRRREKKRMLPDLLTAQTPHVLQLGQGSNGAANLSYEIVPIKRHNLHQNVPPF